MTRPDAISLFGGKATLAPDVLPDTVIDDALGEQVKTALRLRLPLRFGASCAAHERCDSRENEKHTILRSVVVRPVPGRSVS